MEKHVAEAEEFREKFAEKFGSAGELKKALEMVSKACGLAGLDEGLYFRHNTGVAKNLLDIGLEKDVVIAGLVHNVVKHGISGKEVEEAFGGKVLELIDEKARLEKALLFKPQDRENSRKKLLVVLSTNPGAVLLELSERLDKLRRLQNVGESARPEFLAETREVFANLAHKIGIYSISSEMNELVFSHEEPEKYSQTEKALNELMEHRGKDIQESRKTLEKELEKAGIKAGISGRVKTVFSAYAKMKRKNIPLERVYDLNALRVVVGTEKDCYEVLGIVHSIWKPIPSEFDDYIAKQKKNGYRSLHTAVYANNNKPLEVQIRTHEMDDFAEFGVASHWRYKGEKKDAKYDRKIDWVKQVIEWQKSSSDEKPEIDIFGKEIFALTPKGEVIELPEGSTVIDFAYAVHTDIGNKCQGGKINGNMVSLNTRIRNADVVEIITSEKRVPKMSWLGFAKTEKAKQKIRMALNIRKGHSVQENALQLKGHQIKTDDRRVRLAKCCTPVPGDEITAFKTSKRKISVHRADCPEAGKSSGQKMDVVWRNQVNEYDVELEMTAKDRIGILKDALEVFSKGRVYVKRADARAIESNTIRCGFSLKIKNLEQLEIVIGKLKADRDVLKVYRK